MPVPSAKAQAMPATPVSTQAEVAGHPDSEKGTASAAPMKPRSARSRKARARSSETTIERAMAKSAAPASPRTAGPAWWGSMTSPRSKPATTSAAAER
ncbi:MAG: hypothetical protein QM765_06610 [Myxococcales bacterium]